MKCPSCGHENDPGNRFCEYCGARLEGVQEATVSGQGMAGADSSYDAPTMFVPSEQDRPAPTPADEPASPPPAPAPSADAATGVVCSVCGHHNQPDDRFCDQCGAILESEPVSAPMPMSLHADPRGKREEMIDDRTIVTPATPMPSSDDRTVVTAAESSSASVGPDAPTPPGGTPMPNQSAPQPDPLLAEMVMSQPDEPAAPPPSADAAMSESAPSEPAADAMPSEAAAPSAAAEPAAGVILPVTDADRDALELAVQEQRDNLALFEQMSTRYAGRDVPAHIQSGMDESRRSLADAEQRLTDYDSSRQQASQPDPTEIERLNRTISEHRDNLTMYEQMASRYAGRDVPAYIQTGLSETRTALQQSQDSLAALQTGEQPKAAPVDMDVEEASVFAGDADPVSTTVGPPATNAPVGAPLPSTPIGSVDNPLPEAAVTPPQAELPQPMPTPQPDEQAQAMPTAEPQAQPAPMPPAQPRLVVEGSGASIELPTDTAVIVVGREDPISGIFPEVDLTAHGGESGGVSRQHAKLHHEDGGWKLEDLNSTNYTKLNNTKLEPNTPTALNDGDRIHFGRVAMTFHTQ